MKIVLLQPFKILHKMLHPRPFMSWPSGLTFLVLTKEKRNLCEVHNCHVGEPYVIHFLSIPGPFMRASKVPLSYITV